MKKFNRQAWPIIIPGLLSIIVWFLSLLSTLEILGFHIRTLSPIALFGICTINLIILNKPLNRDCKIVLIVFQILLALAFVANVIFTLNIYPLSKDAYVAYLVGTTVLALVACGYAYYFVRYPASDAKKAQPSDEEPPPSPGN